MNYRLIVQLALIFCLIFPNADRFIHRLDSCIYHTENIWSMKNKSKKGDRPLFSGIAPSGSGFVVKECDFYPFSFPGLLRVRPDPYSFKKGACPLFIFFTFFWNIGCSESSFLIKDEKIDVEFHIRMSMIKTVSLPFPGIEKKALTKKAAKQSKIFEALMAHKEKVFLICLGFSRNPTDAEDLAQEVYLKVYKNIDTVKDSESSKYWLFKVTRNTCLDFHRKHKHRRHSPLGPEHEPSESITPESQLAFREQLQTLKAAIQQLPKKQKEVFILREYGDLTYQEMADVLKINKGTVMSRLTRARQALMNQMKGE
jgi:RNA polymerase sigma-70 factor (ECF subfamily)